MQKEILKKLFKDLESKHRKLLNEHVVALEATFKAQKTLSAARQTIKSLDIKIKSLEDICGSNS